MSRTHERFEALAGAIALGEADESQRAEYAAHAATCPQCDARIAERGKAIGALFERAAGSETWRPFVRDEVVARIERRRTSAVRRVATFLGAGVVATVGLNLVLALAPLHIGPSLTSSPKTETAVSASGEPLVAAAPASLQAAGAQAAPPPGGTIVMRPPALAIERAMARAGETPLNAPVTFVSFPRPQGVTEPLR